MPRLSYLLTIAGFDPSGGGGVLADVETFVRLGFAGKAVVTAITAQNRTQARAVHSLSAAWVQKQAETLLSEEWPQAVKVGMLGSKTVALQVARLRALNLNESRLLVRYSRSDSVGPDTVGKATPRTPTAASIVNRHGSQSNAPSLAMPRGQEPCGQGTTRVAPRSSRWTDGSSLGMCQSISQPPPTSQWGRSDSVVCE